MPFESELYSPASLESLDEDTLIARIRQLTTAINARLAGAKDLASFQECLYSVIDDLKLIGHDLWSHDYDGDVERWGGDYMHPTTAGKLWLVSTYPDGVELSWKAWSANDAD